MKNLFRLLLLVGMLSVAPQAWAVMCINCGGDPDPDPVWTPQITLNHFEPNSVEATDSSFYLSLKRTNNGEEYYLVLRMWINDNGGIEVLRSCEGSEAVCEKFSHGKDCDSDPVPWCYMGK